MGRAYRTRELHRRPPVANQAPDGTADWNNYALAADQLPDAADPNGDPANIALLAVDKATGALYQSVSGGCPSNCAVGPLAGTYGTWTQVATPSGWPTVTQWTSGQVTLVSADANNGSSGPGSGATELWTRNGSTVTSWEVTGITNLSLQQEASSSAADPSNDWPLNDGDPNLRSPNWPYGSVAGLPGCSRLWSVDDEPGDPGGYRLACGRWCLVQVQRHPPGLGVRDGGGDPDPGTGF